MTQCSEEMAHLGEKGAAGLVLRLLSAPALEAWLQGCPFIGDFPMF